MSFGNGSPSKINGRYRWLIIKILNRLAFLEAKYPVKHAILKGWDTAENNMHKNCD